MARAGLSLKQLLDLLLPLRIAGLKANLVDTLYGIADNDNDSFEKLHKAASDAIHTLGHTLKHH